MVYLTFFKYYAGAGLDNLSCFLLVSCVILAFKRVVLVSLVARIVMAHLLMEIRR